MATLGQAPRRLSSPPAPKAVPTDDAEARLTLLRLIDGQIIDRNPRPAALKALDTLATVLANALRSFADEPGLTDDQKDKFRKLRLNNAAVKRTVIDVIGAQDYLHAAKFVSQVQLFEPYLVFPSKPTPSQLAALTLAHTTLTSRLDTVRHNEGFSQALREREAAAEAARVDNVRESIRDDRARVDRRAERERLARKAAAERKAAEEASERHLDPPPLETEPTTESEESQQ